MNVHLFSEFQISFPDCFTILLSCLKLLYFSLLIQLFWINYSILYYFRSSYRSFYWFHCVFMSCNSLFSLFIWLFKYSVCLRLLSFISLRCDSGRIKATVCFTSLFIIESDIWTLFLLFTRIFVKLYVIIYPPRAFVWIPDRRS